MQPAIVRVHPMDVILVPTSVDHRSPPHTQTPSSPFPIHPNLPFPFWNRLPQIPHPESLT
jgi:hypothetical protein